MDGDAAEGGAVGAASNDAAAAAAGLGVADAVGASGFDSTGIIGMDPGTALAAGQMAMGMSPTEMAMMSQSTPTGSNISTGGFTMSELGILSSMGMGNVAISANQTVDQALAAANFSSALNFAPQVMALAVPGFGTAMSIAQLGQGLLSGQITPGQALTNIAMGTVANQLGMPAATLTAIVNGNMGQAAAQTAMGMVSSALSQATGMSPGVVGLGLAATGITSAINSATSQPGITNLGQMASAIDNSLTGMGLSLGGGTTGGTGAMSMADATNQPADYLSTILGIGSNLIATEYTGNVAQDAAATRAAAANQAAAIQAAAAQDVRKIQQDLRAPYTGLGQTAAQQYAAGIAPGGQFARPFSMADAQNTQAMRLAQQEAAAATEQSAASRGGLLTANTQEALQKRAAQIAAQYQNQAFNQYVAQQQLLQRPLETAMTLGAGQAGAQAGAESEAQMLAGQGAANALLAGAGLTSAADIAQANARARFGTNAVDQLVKLFTSSRAGGGGGGIAPVANVPVPNLPSLDFTMPGYSLIEPGSSNYFGSPNITGPGIGGGSGYSLVPPTTPSGSMYDFSGSTVRFGG